MTDRMEVQRTIPAPAADIFAVLCDPQGHVAIDATGMLQDADGEPVSRSGDSFVIHMDREALNDFPMGKYDVTVEIREFEKDRLIAWTILGKIRPQIGHVYGYRLEPRRRRHVVTSFYDWSDIDPRVAQSQHLPGRSGERAARDAGHPRPHGAPRLSPRLITRQPWVDDRTTVNLELTP